MNRMNISKAHIPLLICILFIDVPQATATELHADRNSYHQIDIENPQISGQISTSQITIERPGKLVIGEDRLQAMNGYIKLHRRWKFTRKINRHE